MSLSIQLAERGCLPDTWVRHGIRRLLRQRIREIGADPRGDADWIRELGAGAVAEATDAANEQHYELPPDYFATVLGPLLKYSSGFWEAGAGDLASAEADMLRLTCERAGITDGQRVLDLGCGWGSVSLWIARRFPGCRVTAVSNSRAQARFIKSRASGAGLANLRAITADINQFDPAEQFDRIVSVEMFEHVRNHRELLRRVRRWLAPGGRLFVHIFAHRRHAYLFENQSAKNWMTRHFFTGGIMPSEGLLPACAAGAFEAEAIWSVNGRNYSRTLEAWLRRHDANRAEVMRIFRGCYGSPFARLWFHRWRLFYLACSELFAYNAGDEWRVAHYRFRPADA